jgi:hypothetical protein
MEGGTGGDLNISGNSDFQASNTDSQNDTNDMTQPLINQGKEQNKSTKKTQMA